MTTVVFITIGLLLSFLGVFLTAFAVGSRESLSKTSENYDSLGKAVRISLLLLFLLAGTLLCMSFLISAWFLLTFIPSIGIGWSVKSGTQENVQSNQEAVSDAMPIVVQEQPEMSGLPWSPEAVRGGELRNANLAGIDLNGANLFMADLAGADLTGADLGEALLTGANLTAAKLNNCFLQGAYLTGAFLTYADLSGANLTLADLRGTDMRGAKLIGVLGLVQAQLDTAMTDENTIVEDHLTIAVP